MTYRSSCCINGFYEISTTERRRLHDFLQATREDQARLGAGQNHEVTRVHILSHRYQLRFCPTNDMTSRGGEWSPRKVFTGLVLKQISLLLDIGPMSSMTFFFR